jgi:hypothetical protein
MLAKGDILTQQQFENICVEVFVKNNWPIEQVEKEPYKMQALRLVGEKNFEAWKLKFLSARTLKRRIEQRYGQMKSDLMQILAGASTTCTTSDIWTKYGKSFIAVTVHWIDPQSLVRFKALLSVKQFDGSHTYDRIAKRLYLRAKEFNIVEKTQFCITDGGKRNWENVMHAEV